MASARTSLSWVLLGSLTLLAGACGRTHGGTGDSGVDGGDGGSAVSLLCGNGSLDPGEQCDDGNTRFGDGCDGTCQREPGWSCTTPGDPCSVAPACGDGFIESTEECDDGNTAGGTLVPPGGVRLADGGIAGLDGGVEELDGGVDPGDGCTSDCKVVPGWSCPDEGRPCHAALCGDGIVAGAEQCDDGNSASNDGCSADCVLENGFYCPNPGQACVHTVCGDGIVQGTEQCDDQNNNLGDGCAPGCVREPLCVNGDCQDICGDGVILPNDTTEQCDDGNNRPGDGCSPTCTIEKDFACSFSTDAPPATLPLTVVYRDLRRHDTTPNAGHIDFNNVNHAETGILGPLYSLLDPTTHKPVYAYSASAVPSGSTTHGPVAFNAWYNDVPLTGNLSADESANKTVVSSLVLTRQSDGSYVFDSQLFFPIDGLGWDSLSPSDPLYEPQSNANDGHPHNFSFTSEVRYWFQYKGTEVLTFRGDDDVWVFINDKLALDLGGVHGAENGTVTLSSVSSQLGLVVGKIYEVVVLQAERHVNASSYRLTLNNFEAKHTICKNLCGDGIVEADQGEECDDGNTVSGDGCSSTCVGEIN